MDVRCPECGEETALRGERRQAEIFLTCLTCGHRWERDPAPACRQCGSRDLQPVPLAIVEKGRGTQLSVVGTRTIHLCFECDADTLSRWNQNRPNPLMPDELPTTGDQPTD